MDLADLHIFRTVVTEGGVTRAAERLNRVQSNVTTRVRQLEEDLGVLLFIREGKRLHLSPTGRVLLDYADRPLDLAQEARVAVRDNAPRGPLRLGAMESTAAIRLPAPLSEFHRRYPEVKLDLSTRPISELTERVLAGDLDAALVAEPISDAFEKAKIYDEELALVSAADHARSVHRAMCNRRPYLHLSMVALTDFACSSGLLARASCPRGSSKCHRGTPFWVAPLPAWASR